MVAGKGDGRPGNKKREKDEGTYFMTFYFILFYFGKYGIFASVNSSVVFS